MAYTYTIDVSQPTGGTAANTADEEFRSLKAALVERLQDMIGGASPADINSDPVVPPGGGLLDPTIGVMYPVGPYLVGALSGSAQYYSDGSIFDLANGAGTFVIPLMFRPGVVIDTIALYYSKDIAGDSISMGFYRKQFPTAAETITTGATTTLAGPLTMDVSPNHTITAGYSYFVSISYLVAALSDGLTIHGIKVNVA